MESQQADPVPPPPATSAEPQNPVREAPPSLLSTSGITSWARNLKIPSQAPATEDSRSGNAGKSTFARLTSGIGLRLSPKSPQSAAATAEESAEGGVSTAAQPGVFGSITRGFVDSSKSAVKAVQVKARHIVSQNKRRYQEGGFDLDMTYITENIIAMGFPAGDMSSGFFGYVEGFYRNHMDEVIKFFETHHKGKYKVYNLCSERLYDASLFEGKVACFPFDDHNCPPIQLITLFCQSAYSWLKEDIENVVVVHCKAGMARTGLMISSLLLFLKFFPTAEESIDYYNQKRCVDGKGLVLPSQIPEDFWFSAPKKGIMVFALPGEPGLTELAGDFKIHFHDRQGDFYCWLNTTMMENRKVLTTSDLDGFDKRKLPSPGFQVEVVLVDYNGSLPPRQTSTTDGTESSNASSVAGSTTSNSTVPPPNSIKEPGSSEKDDVFSDSESEGTGSSKSRRPRTAVTTGAHESSVGGPETTTPHEEMVSVTHRVEQVKIGGEGATQAPVADKPKAEGTTGSVSGYEVPIVDSTGSGTVSEFKAIAADASVFTFGDEEDYESE
ncbi:hypothetical protein QJS04_geneDACA011857 [Acorus gramineus]|uniref:Uncharacterized protein n=1 Tax=Acorus gramineus TaxID=55184 RepID=A0AAV9AHV8_ACOGR|nr:hypothetical protein QJS04_geneDACA011857 [Acorus gramineus]